MSKPSKEQIIHELAITYIKADPYNGLDTESIIEDNEALVNILKNYRLYTDYLDKKWDRYMGDDFKIQFRENEDFIP